MKSLMLLKMWKSIGRMWKSIWVLILLMSFSKALAQEDISWMSASTSDSELLLQENFQQLKRLFLQADCLLPLWQR